MQVTVYSAHPFEKKYLLAANNQQYLNLIPEQLSLGTVNLAAGSEAISIFTQDDASAAVLEKLAEIGVKYIATRSAGHDHIDLIKAKDLGIKVARVPAYSPYAIAEHAVALMLALNRKLITAHNQLNQNNFLLDNLVGFDMNGKTVGIIGLGRTGSVAAKILHGFGCRILVSDIVPPAVSDIPLEHVPLNYLLATSDIITLHAPLTSETKYIINAESIAEMKEGVMLINTSRGSLINTADLINGLRSCHIGAAGLDVYENEKKLFFRNLSGQVLPDALFEELRALPNVLITGHQAFLTSTALKNISDTTIYNLDCWENNILSGNELE